MIGRVLQVNVSPGGVPKLPVEHAWVGPLGLDGDAHRADTTHGGPHRAVAIFAIEAIRRVAAEGHPIGPGAAGENLTTEGIEWATLPIGTRAAIGDGGLLLELSKPDMPCDTIGGAFRDGRSGRISILTHPLDSRMYARVLVPGEVRPGDRIRILAPSPDSRAELHELLDRIESTARGFNVALWTATAAAGYDVRVVDDGELAMVAAPELPGRKFNRASGYRQLPNLLPRMIDWFRTNGTVGWISAEAAPWPGAIAEHASAIFAAPPETIRIAADGSGSIGLPPGLTVRECGRDDAAAFSEVLITASSIPAGQAPAWQAAIGRLIGAAGHHFYLVEDAGRSVAVANQFVRRRVAMLGMAAVLPSHRGRGIQRALVAHRAARAAEDGATIVAAGAGVGSRSAANLRIVGMERVWDTALYRVPPASARG